MKKLNFAQQPRLVECTYIQKRTLYPLRNGRICLHAEEKASVCSVHESVDCGSVQCGDLHITNEAPHPPPSMILHSVVELVQCMRYYSSVR